MARPASRIWVLALFSLLIVVAAILLESVSRLTKVEHTIQTIQHEVVLTPCASGDSVACRLFLARLLKAATPAQLAQLRGGRLSVGKAIRQIQQLAQAHPNLFKPVRPKAAPRSRLRPRPPRPLSKGGPPSGNPSRKGRPR